VAGHFSSDGSAFESEIWGENEQLMPVLRGEFYQVIVVRLTLGFKPRSVLASFLTEATFLALVGGVLGCLVALPINGIVTSTTNWSSFSMIAFRFLVTPRILLEGMVFSMVMGVLGGYFPARRAARMPVVQAIR
jgi:putative ABC transport system permease protein